MQIPVQVTFKGVPVDDAIERLCIEQAEALERFGPLVSCRVVIDKPHQHKRSGNLYDIRLDVKLPGREIAVSRTSTDQVAHERAEVAVREAFNDARRQIEHALRARREHT